MNFTRRILRTGWALAAFVTPRILTNLIKLRSNRTMNYMKTTGSTARCQNRGLRWSSKRFPALGSTFFELETASRSRQSLDPRPWPSFSLTQAFSERNYSRPQKGPCGMQWMQKQKQGRLPWKALLLFKLTVRFSLPGRFQ